METKALSFALSLNDLTNNRFTSNTPHAAAKVSVFTVRCSSSGTLSLGFFFFRNTFKKVLFFHVPICSLHENLFFFPPIWCECRIFRF